MYDNWHNFFVFVGETGYEVFGFCTKNHYFHIDVTAGSVEFAYVHDYSVEFFYGFTAYDYVGISDGFEFG